MKRLLCYAARHPVLKYALAPLFLAGTLLWVFWMSFVVWPSESVRELLKCDCDGDEK